jgi:predicted site-specific integrase-resolvase
MKLSQYARQQGSSYRTALRWWRAGALKGSQAPTGTSIVPEGKTRPEARPRKVAIAARVSSAEHREHLERPAARVADYCAACGSQLAQVVQVVKEIASGANDRRPKLLAWLKDTPVTGIVVEQRDRLTRCGFR